MERKQVSVLITVVVMFIVTFDCGNCSIHGKIGKVESISSGTRLEDFESVLLRGSRSVHRSRRSVLNSTEQPVALDEHNRLRRLEGASNMELMIWDNDLASEAENTANKCIWNHSNTYYGQNLYATDDYRPINLTAAIEAWYKEKPNYSTYLSTGQCNPPDRPCIHYSQVVWAASRKLGCAYTRCTTLFGAYEANALFLVCNYDPPGNVVGESPFATGSACTQCASGSWWCNNGLCDQSCTETGYRPTCACNPVCQNSASVNRASCSCSCAPGWYGTDCSAVCENKDSMCDPKPGQAGYPPSYCTREDYGSRVRVICPKMCSQCLDCSALICYNSGTVNANCSCSCAPGWRGSDCSVSCIDFDSRCNPKAGAYGWPPSYCSHGQYGATVREKCPAMCNQCQAVCVDYDSRCDPQPGEYGWPSYYCTHSEYGNATRRFCPAMCKVCQAGGRSNYDVPTSTRALLLSILTALMFRSTC